MIIKTDTSEKALLKEAQIPWLVEGTLNETKIHQTNKYILNKFNLSIH